MDTNQKFSKEDGRPIFNTVDMKLLDEKSKLDNWVTCRGNAREPLDFETDVCIYVLMILNVYIYVCMYII